MFTKSLTLCLLLGITSLITTSVHGQVIIDDFTTSAPEVTIAGPSSETDNPTVNGNTFTRYISVTGSGALVGASVDSGVFKFISDPADSFNQGELLYSDFSFDLRSTPVLKIVLPSINGGGLYSVVLGSSTGSPIATFGNLPGGSSGTILIDVRGLTVDPDTFLQGVNQVGVTFNGSTGPFFGINASEISFVGPESLSLAPEPGTFALLFATLPLLAYWQFRRTRKI